MPPLHVLFAVQAWGLGHATRDLVLIRGLLGAGHRVTILATGRALVLLRDELGEACTYVELGDIPKPLGRHASSFYLRMSLSMPEVFWIYRQERLLARRLVQERGINRIVSDSRYGVCLSEVPSFHIVHSLRQVIPGRPGALEKFVEASQRHLLRHGRILIPDQEEDGLAGDLCHNLACDWNSGMEYLGILSSVGRQDLQEDVDVFVSISGAEPQRTFFEELVLARVRELGGRIVVALGNPDAPGIRSDDGRVTVHGYLDRDREEEMLNRARLVVTRPGYTTLMELAELGKPALLVPTVGQSEQEYLGDRLEALGLMHCVRQQRLDLPQDVEAARTYPGLPRMHPTRESVDHFLAAVTA